VKKIFCLKAGRFGKTKVKRKKMRKAGRFGKKNEKKKLKKAGRFGV